MITKDSIEAAYCFFHQKYQVTHSQTANDKKDASNMPYSSYVDGMSSELYKLLANGREEFLFDT